MSLGLGGTQTFTLDAGVPFAGDVYVLLGTTSGTAPGISFGAFQVPLNLDAYTNFTLANPNSPPLSSSLGVLSALGDASAQFGLPAGSSSALIGRIVDHAYVLVDPQTIKLSLVSNPVSVLLTP